MPCELLFFKDNPHDFVNECNKTVLVRVSRGEKKQQISFGSDNFDIIYYSYVFVIY